MISPSSVLVSYVQTEGAVMSDLKEKLRAIVAEVAEIDEVPDTEPFKDFGIAR